MFLDNEALLLYSLSERLGTDHRNNLLKIYRGVEQLVARRAHNPKVVSSSLTPATSKRPSSDGLFLFCYKKKKKNNIEFFIDIL